MVDHIATCSRSKWSVEGLGGTYLCSEREYYNNAVVVLHGIIADSGSEQRTNPVVHLLEQHRKGVTVFNRCQLQLIPHYTVSPPCAINNLYECLLARSC